MRNWTEFRKLSDGGASLLFLRMRIAIRTAPVAAHVSLGQLELLSFVFAKLAAVLFHPDWLDTYFEVVQQHIWRSLFWERHYLCIPHIWCHIRLITCIVDSNSVLFLIFHTYNLQDKKKVIKAVIAHCTQALSFPLWFPLFSNDDMLTDLAHILWCTVTPCVLWRPAKAERLFFFFFFFSPLNLLHSKSGPIFFIFLFFSKRSTWQAGWRGIKGASNLVGFPSWEISFRIVLV